MFFAVSAETQAEVWPWEDYTLAESRVETSLPETDLFAGIDPITPPEGTEKVAKALRTTALLFPNAGHGGVGSSDCARQIYIDFMDEPGVGEAGIPDTTECMDDLGPPQFI